MPRMHRTEAETRGRVSDAVVDYVATHGLGVRPEIPMEVVLEAAQVSRASAYRIWSGKEAFSAFALEQCAAGHAVATVGVERAMALALEAAEETSGRLEGAVRFLCRAASEELDILLDSDPWRAFIRFQAAVVDDPTPALGHLLAEIDAEDTDRLTRVYEAVAEAWSLVPIPEGGVRAVAESVLLLSRSTVSRIVSGRDEVSSRRNYADALAGLVRGSFREVPGGVVDLERARDLWSERVEDVGADRDQS